MICCLIGPPLSGKTTVARLVSEKLGCNSLSTGQVCRDLGLKPEDIQSIQQTDRAESMNEAVFAAVEHAVLWNPDLLLLDGFPRSVEQLERLRVLIGGNRDILIFYLWVNPIFQLERLKNRKRDDADQLAVIKGRTFASISLFNELSSICSEYSKIASMYIMRDQNDNGKYVSGEICSRILQRKGVLK